MAQVTKYDTKAAYAADAARLKSESAVSYINENRSLVLDGVNCLVEKDSAGEGDLVVFDKVESRIRYIKGPTVVKAQLPAVLVPMGVVYKREGDRLMVVSLSNHSARWAHSFEAMLSGIATAAAGSITVKTETAAGVDSVTVNWTAGV